MNFQPHIIPVYPAHNEIIFEEWLAQNYKGCNTDRELLPVFFTSFYVNNNYGNDLEARKELQDYLNSLDRTKKYFCCNQYDDSILEDVSHLDLLRFEMSKNIGVPIPLLCQPHPYAFAGSKKYLSNFVGSRTHPLRDTASQYKNEEGFYICYERLPIEQYCEILSQSLFTLCYRGYGANSFRIAESMQFSSIPVYISDEFIIPWGLDFESFGVLVEAKDSGHVFDILNGIPTEDILEKQNNLKSFYEKYYTYEGNLSLIIQYLENESSIHRSNS